MPRLHNPPLARPQRSRTIESSLAGQMVNGNALYEATYHWQTTFPRSNCSYPEGHFSQARHPLPLSCVARCAVRRITKLNAILLSGRPEQAASAALPDWNTAQNEFAVERGLHHVAFVLNGKVRGMGLLVRLEPLCLVPRSPVKLYTPGIYGPC